MMITRRIEHHKGQTFTLSSYHCKYCGGKGFYELDRSYDEPDEFAYCPHCKHDTFNVLYNPDVTLPLLNAGTAKSIVDSRTWTTEVTRSAEQWAVEDALNETMNRLSRSLAMDLFGDGSCLENKVFVLGAPAKEDE